MIFDRLHNGQQRLAARARHIVSWNLRERRKRKRRRNDTKVFSTNTLLRDTANSRYRHDVRDFWREHYGKPVNSLYHVACANVTGKEDVRYIPNDVWYDEFLPFFNKVPMRTAYIDKNLSDVLLGDVVAPATILKRMHGRYYTGDNEWISRDAARNAILGASSEQIIKPSLTDNGVGIRLIRVDGRKMTLDGQLTTLEKLEHSHGADFIVQSRVEQHEVMAEPHPGSVNTIRLVTFRWNGDITVLLSFARFGVDGKLTDNAGTGGVCCGIDEEGRMNATAVDKHGTVHERHPTTAYAFANRRAVPGFIALCEQATTLHRRLFHFDIVSWDFAVGKNSEPIFLEYNFQGVSYLYQFACGKPIFGALTEDVLGLMRANKWKRAGARLDAQFVSGS